MPGKPIQISRMNVLILLLTYLIVSGFRKTANSSIRCSLFPSSRSSQPFLVSLYRSVSHCHLGLFLFPSSTNASILLHKTFFFRLPLSRNVIRLPCESWFSYPPLFLTINRRILSLSIPLLSNQQCTSDFSQDI